MKDNCFIIKKDKKFFSFLVVLLPFLYQYKSPISNISFGEFILIPFMVYYLIIDLRKKINFSPFNGMYTYWGIALLMTLFAMLQPHFQILAFNTVFIRIVYYSILIYVSYKHINIEYALNVAEILAVFFSIYAVIQFVVHSVNGTILPTIINSSWVFESEAGIRLNYTEYYRWTYRSSSLFLEPSYFAAFCSVGLCYSVFSSEKSKLHFVFSLLITLGLVVSTSSAGLFIIIIVWGLYFFITFFKNGKKMTYKSFFVTLLFLIFSFYVFNSSMATTLLERTATGGSFSNRITRGFIIADYLNFFQKIVGVGINNLGNFVQNHNIITKYDEVGMLNYASSMIGTYLCSGVITLFFYLRFFIKSWRNRNNDIISKSLILILLFLSAIEMNSYTYRFAFFVIFIIAIQQTNLLNKREGEKK